MSSEIKFIFDDGHGWLAVDLNQHPEASNFGTGYGFIDKKKSVIYLEEDVEAFAFLGWLWNGDTSKAKLLPHEIVNGSAFVRRLPRNEAVYSGHN